MDKLTEQAVEAKRRGMTYGQYQAMFGSREMPARRTRLDYILSGSDEEIRKKVGVCNLCGKQFAKTKPQERYCSDECRKEMNRRNERK